MHKLLQYVYHIEVLIQFPRRQAEPLDKFIGFRLTPLGPPAREGVRKAAGGFNRLNSGHMVNFETLATPFSSYCAGYFNESSASR